MAAVPAGIESPLSLGIHGPGESGRCKTFPPNDSRRAIPDETCVGQGMGPWPSNPTGVLYPCPLQSYDEVTSERNDEKR